MNNPLISIIIPIYNVAFYLRECLDSVLAQSYTNLDIILVDDGSTDGSLDIALEYLNKDARIFLISKENAGLSSARNTGLEFLKGSALRSFFQDKKEENIISFCTTHGFDKDTKILKKETIKSTFTLIQERYIKSSIENINDFIIQELPHDAIIHFLDSDDYFLNNCIELCIKPMLEKDLDICTHNICRYIQNEGKIVNNHYFEIPNSMCKNYYDCALDAIIDCNKYSFVFAWQGIFKARVLNLYKLRFTHGIYNEDNDFGIILFALAKKILFLHEVLMVYRVREDSSSSKNINNNHALPKYLENIRYYFDNDDLLKKYYHCYCVVKSGVVINRFYNDYLKNKKCQYDSFFVNSLAWHCNILKIDLKKDPLNIIKLIKSTSINKISLLKHCIKYLMRHPKKIKNIKNLFYL
ncbi:glycosyltransferase [Campylobacter sp. VicNov18]|uniref:glycosyltransferase family 2 protein n=6 Tax=Campylobacter bilis TaxID=2691918 RepID=UPI001E42BC3E|nr:glycosyltransferase [Campylobacter bilis]MCC8298772.1 glycosyltransferase [Campylobacter bilis]